MQNTINTAIKKFFNENWSKKDFLTEDDIRCRLFSTLNESLVNSGKNASVHSEIRWYGDSMPEGEKKLRYRSDIVIIDSDDLQIDDSFFELPSKGYGFNRYYSIIEIKLRRPNDNNPDNKYNNIIQKDIDKLKKIRDKTTGGGITDKSYFMIAFDKKNNKKILKDISDSDNNLSWQNWNNN